MRSRFVKPEVVRLQLSDGDWVEVKRRITAGEMRAIVRTALAESSTVIVAREMAEWMSRAAVVEIGTTKVTIIDPELVKQWQDTLSRPSSAASRGMDIDRAQVLIYLIGWSLKDEQGNTVPI